MKNNIRKSCLTFELQNPSSILHFYLNEIYLQKTVEQNRSIMTFGRTTEIRNAMHMFGTLT